MRIILLTSLAMLAFAANSILNRAGLLSGGIDPFGFAAIRTISGALVLTLALYLRQRKFFTRPKDIWAPAGLLLYMLAFSFAYTILDAGYGALLLFGAVQLSMFLFASRTASRPLKVEILGSVLAFAGLIYLVAPGLQIGGLLPSLAMIGAGIGWASFTLSGKGAVNPLNASAASFAVIAPITLIAWVAVGVEMPRMDGMIYAIASGAITSAIGYLIWYSVLPQLAVPTAALVQLTVPIIAILGGVLWLGEAVSLRLVIAATLVTLGVAMGIEARRRASKNPTK